MDCCYTYSFSCYTCMYLRRREEVVEERERREGGGRRGGRGDGDGELMAVELREVGVEKGG